MLRNKTALLITGITLACVAFLLGRASHPAPAAEEPVDWAGDEAAGESERGGEARAEVRDSPGQVFDGGTVALSVMDGGFPPGRRLVDQLMHHVDFNAAREPQASSERLANLVHDETIGIALAAQAYPEIAADLHDELRARLCRPGGVETERVVLLRLMLVNPSIVDPVAVECTLEQERTENPVLWTALRVHREAGLPPTPQTARWSEIATDERTLDFLGRGTRRREQ